jgi:hypothetical protein
MCRFLYMLLDLCYLSRSDYVDNINKNMTIANSIDWALNFDLHIFAISSTCLFYKIDYSHFEPIYNTFPKTLQPYLKTNSRIKSLFLS